MNTQKSQAAERIAQGLEHKQRRQDGPPLQPALDIFEDSDALTLEADMPGVSKERLNVHVEGDSLIVEGRVLFEMPAQAQAVYADVRSTLYRCSFALSRELEVDQIRANLKDGVVQVRIPKRAELKPRRIMVEV